MAEYLSRDDTYECLATGFGDRMAEDIIKLIPIADVQPVKCGRWELTDNPSFRKCSECGAWWSSDITDNCFTKYCPKCGARIIKDGEQNEQINA